MSTFRRTTFQNRKVSREKLRERRITLLSHTGLIDTVLQLLRGAGQESG